MMGLRMGLGLSRRGGAVAFPLSTSPTAWYDPSDLSTMFQTGTRAAPGAAVTASGDPVGLILDKSGNNNDLVQATAASRPIYTVAGATKYLLFDGVDDRVKGPFGAALAQPFRRISAINQVTWTGGEYIFDGGVDDEMQLAQRGTTPQIEMYAGLAVACNNGAATIGSNFVVEELFNGASSTMIINGGTATTGNPGANSLSGLSIGGPGTVASVFANAQCFGVFVGNFTLAQTLSLRTWLGAKAGLTL